MLDGIASSGIVTNHDGRPFRMSRYFRNCYWMASLSLESTMPKVAAKNVRLKRAYEKPSREDGTRILVDRLWPRGLKKEAAGLDDWAKGLAPSTELRKWFGHDPKLWPVFRRRYTAELRQQTDLLSSLKKLARQGPITLIYPARDESHNEAVVLRELLVK